MDSYTRWVHVALHVGHIPTSKQPSMAGGIKARERAEAKHGPCPDNIKAMADHIRAVLRLKRMRLFRPENVMAMLRCTEPQAKAACYWLGRECGVKYDKEAWAYYFE